MAKPESSGTEKSAEIVNDAALEGIAGGAHEAGQASEIGDLSAFNKELSELTAKLNPNITPLELQTLQGEFSVLTDKVTAKLHDITLKH